jgi:hypothetical protein
MLRHQYVGKPYILVTNSFLSNSKLYLRCVDFEAGHYI